MNRLVAIVGDARSLEPEEAAAVLAGDAELRWQEGTVSLAGCGPLASLAVAPDLVVLALGRVDEDGVSARGTAAERVLAAVRSGRPDWLDGVVGDVSGVVVDRATAAVTAFRDLVGAQPLHLARAGDRWLVASRATDLLAPDGPVPAAVSEEWVAAYLEARFPPPRLTPFAGITSLLPGHTAQPRSASWLQTRRAHWRVAVERRSDAGHAEALRAVLDEAVRRRLEGARSAAVQLSGGLDSTSVLACARAVRPDIELVALAIPFTDPAGDERALQAATAERCGARLRWVPLDGYGPFDPSPDDVVHRLGSVPPSPNWFFHAACADAAADERVDLVLTGEDGDGVLGGGPVALADLLTRGRLLRFAREAGAVHRRLGTGRRRLLRRTLEAARWREPRTDEPPLSALVPERLQRRTARPRPVAPGRLWRDHVDRYLSSDYLVWLAAALEVPWRDVPRGASHPFLDRRVVELCLGLPSTQRQSDGAGKAVLRRAMAGRLPAEVLGRSRKARLSGPFDAALRAPEGTRVVEAAHASAQADPPAWLSVDGWAALRSSPPSAARGFAEYRAVLGLALDRSTRGRQVSAGAAPALSR